MNVLLVNPPLRSPTNRFGVGFQAPLGLLMVAGPLVDDGHRVALLDADALGLRPRDIARTAADLRIDALLVGHSGSTAANPVSIEVFRAVKSLNPAVLAVYGGVYPTYAAGELMRRERAIDIVVRGEGEETTRQLLRTIEERASLWSVNGITWRDRVGVHWNPNRRTIPYLDAHRVAWELVDWKRYRAFGRQGPSAGIQFSRGCPHPCSYCGQRGFWRRWRHRSVDSFTQDIQLLHDRFGVRTLWLADENPADDAALFHDLLYAIASLRLDLAIYCSLCATDVHRDLDVLDLYRDAGIRFVLMGVESGSEDVLQTIRKSNPPSMVKGAVSGLRKHGILSIVNYVFGIRDESRHSMCNAIREIRRVDADFVNALYFTPHGWTPEGRRTAPDRIIQLDQARWCYRNQVLDSGIAPRLMFFWVKLIELLAHCRLRVVLRLIRYDSECRSLLVWCLIRISVVWIFEVYDQIARVRFRRDGALDSDTAAIMLPDGRPPADSHII